MGAAFDAISLRAVTGYGPVRAAVRLATTANHGLSGLAAIDGVTPAEGDRVLAWTQTDPKQNGIYLASAGTWTRSEDFIKDAQVKHGLAIAVLEGSTHELRWFQLTSPTTGSIRLGVTSLTFERMGVLTPSEVSLIGLLITATSEAAADTLALRDSNADCKFRFLTAEQLLAPVGSPLVLGGATGEVVSLFSGSNRIFDGSVTSSVSTLSLAGSSGGEIKASTAAMPLYLSAGSTGKLYLRSGTSVIAEVLLSSNVGYFAGQGTSGTVFRADSGAVTLQSLFSSVNLTAASGQSITFGEGANTLGSFTNTSGVWSAAMAAARTGMLFSASANASGYVAFRTGASGAMYLDTGTGGLNIRDAAGTTEWLSISQAAGATLLASKGTASLSITMPTKVGAGTGGTLTLTPQQGATPGTDTPGNLAISLGQCTTGGTQESGKLALRDHLGIAASMSFIGTSAEGATNALYLQGAASGTDGRARAVSLTAAFPGSVTITGGSSTADFILDGTGFRQRVSSANRLQHTTTDNVYTAASTGYHRKAWTSVGITIDEYAFTHQTSGSVTNNLAWTGPALANGTVATFELDMVATTDGTNSAGYKLIGTYHTSGGTTTLVGTTAFLHEKETTAAWNVIFSTLTNTVRVAVSAGSGNIRWTGTVKVTVGTSYA